MVQTPVVFDYLSDAFKINSAVLKVILTKPYVNTIRLMLN